MNRNGKSRCGEAKKSEFEFKGLEITLIGKLRCGETKEIGFELNWFGNKQNWENECGEATKFELKGLEMNQIGKLR